MMESNNVINEIMQCFAQDRANHSFRPKIKKICQELGCYASEKPPKIDAFLARLGDALLQASTRQERQLLSMLSGAFSQLKDASRTNAKRELLSGSLSAFYTLSTLPEYATTEFFSHKELRCLAYLGLVAIYYELEDADDLIAEKLALAINEHPSTVAQFIDESQAKQLNGFLSPVIKEMRFAVQGGTVFDKENGLIWLRFALGQQFQDQNQGRLIRYTWKESFTATENFNLQGGFDKYTDWRLPTIDELKTLIDPKEGNEQKAVHFINNKAFPNNYDLFWSSSPSTYNQNVAWIVDFTTGSAFYGNINYGYGVRLVRTA
jgi:hypothetical protein